MYATLYVPQQPPQLITTQGLVLPDAITKLVSIPERVPLLLNCAPGLVDILASDTGYVAYSIFDHEGQINHSAMVALSELTGVRFGYDEDETLCGTILIVQE
ncbi:hypothetical protein [Hymenobacter nivis]|uniref:hypothetical protein n=1 Tax=Hymenobacter nivis TaxID=1850093 RepID=UPI0013A54913|nr:hypothetical protein [Hymenobacter nivis]